MLSTSLQDAQPVAPRDAPSPRASRKIYLSKSKTDSLPSLPFVPAITFHMEPQEFVTSLHPQILKAGDDFDEVPPGPQNCS